MAGRDLVMQLLSECGAQFIGHSNTNHAKYLLPNRRVLTILKSGSCERRSWSNCLARLRREIAGTHPDLSHIRPNHTHPKLRGGTAMGDLLEAKAVSPGAFDLEPQADFYIEDEIITNPLDLTIPEHKSPRIKKDPPPRPGVVRTISPEQLQHFNTLLHSEGETAANAYLTACRSGLVEATKEIQKDRMPPPAPLGPSTKTVAQKEEAMMRELVRRSKMELDKRQARITTMKGQLEADETAALELDYFINDAEKILGQVPGILQLLPSIAEAPTVATPAPVAMPKRGNQGKKLVRIETVIRVVLPSLVSQTWDTTYFHKTLTDSFPDRAVPMKSSVPAMLTRLLKQGHIERIGFGIYTIKEPAAVAA